MASLPLLSSFPSFFSLYALLSPPQNATGEFGTNNSIEFFSFDPISSSWRLLPIPPEDPPLHFLHRHSSFLSQKLPIQSLVSNHLGIIAATTHKLSPALSSPLVFHPESNSWFYGPQISTPRRWCATGSVRASEAWSTWRAASAHFTKEIGNVGYKGKLCMVNVKGNADKEGAGYDVGLHKWEVMLPGMVAGWNGPAAAMDEDVIYVIDEVKGSLSRYDGEGDCWVEVIELEQLKRAEQIAAEGGKICAVSANGNRIIVVDVREMPARFWEVSPPCGMEVVAVHVLPRMISR
ncbi:Glutathione S-transferase TAU 8 [Hibiscus syriacus]|uniref:Glutathione S-transferase TAU 8 n=1 Tax=Hibiscus syriacus TaxID=106335 RepID=A0A6A3A4K3_HIBSY|nr:Glutathione S-transferase TAU 8 [Hibiscus syriacus]